MSTGVDDEIEASRAPLIDHLIELRARLIRAVVAFVAMFFVCFWLAKHIYNVVAPGLYKHERQAFLPYLVATPVLFTVGASVVYFIAMPLLMRFSVGMQQLATDASPGITFLPKVSEYLSLIMTLIFAFGICFQLPVVLTLLARAGIIDSQFLKDKRRYAIVVVFVIAAVLTPPDIISQFALAVPTLLLYEASILSVVYVERRRAEEDAARAAAAAE